MSSTAPARPALMRSALWFVAIGLTNNAIGYGVFALLTVLGVGSVIAATTSYVLGMFISFFGNRNLSFRHSGSHKRTIAKFLLANLVGYLLNLGILLGLENAFGVPRLLAQLCAIAVVASCTFLMMRLWVFRTSDEDR